MPAIFLWRIAGAAGLLLLAACGPGPGEPRPAAGGAVPPVVLTSLANEAPISITTLRGTPLLVNFWATWCGPCRSEMPGLERLSRRLAAEGVRVIGITLDDDLHLAREFIRGEGLTFPNYADPGRAVRSALAVKTLPETVLVSADGRIAARFTGARDWDGDEGRRLLDRAFGLEPAAGQ